FLASAARLVARIAASRPRARACRRACFLPLAAPASRIDDTLANRRRSLRAVRFDLRSAAVVGAGRTPARSARQEAIEAQVVVLGPFTRSPMSNVVVYPPDPSWASVRSNSLPPPWEMPSPSLR